MNHSNRNITDKNKLYNYQQMIKKLERDAAKLQLQSEKALTLLSDNEVKISDLEFGLSLACTLLSEGQTLIEHNAITSEEAAIYRGKVAGFLMSNWNIQAEPISESTPWELPLKNQQAQIEPINFNDKKQTR